MDEPELKIIDVFICKLRKKLSEATGDENYIETVWGRGYVLRDPEPGRDQQSALAAKASTRSSISSHSRLTWLFDTPVPPLSADCFAIACRAVHGLHQVVHRSR
jgi:hypothetical protein